VRVTVFDYGAGNLHSLVRALADAGAAAIIEDNPARLDRASLLVLPGVGAFAPAAAQLAPVRARLRAALADGLPCLGVCLGMQLLFDSSEEGAGAGLGLVPGRVRALATRRRPHMGWNRLEPGHDVGAPLEWAYFAHGFVATPDDPAVVTAWCTHEDQRFPAMVRTARTLGVQFHPEKSGPAGRAFVRQVLEEVPSCV
jgi:glutamine amidotransferase